MASWRMRSTPELVGLGWRGHGGNRCVGVLTDDHDGFVEGRSVVLSAQADLALRWWPWPATAPKPSRRADSRPPPRTSGWARTRRRSPASGKASPSAGSWVPPRASQQPDQPRRGGRATGGARRGHRPLAGGPHDVSGARRPIWPGRGATPPWRHPPSGRPPPASTGSLARGPGDLPGAPATRSRPDPRPPRRPAIPGS
jgi:hypothetical protein